MTPLALNSTTSATRGGDGIWSPELCHARTLSTALKGRIDCDAACASRVVSLTIDILITIAYTALLAWGFWVGVRLIWQGRYRPDTLLNPLFSNRHALRLFALHLVVVSSDLFVVGPLSLAIKSPLWYWGGRIAVLSSSIPIATYLNRNPESFGKLIGRWVVFRNIFEVSLHVAVAAAAINWFNYYVLLWWIVAYRFLDVGPRRLLQTLYNTPEKLAARPWAPTLNWAVVASLYVLTALLVVRYPGTILYAKVPEEGVATHVAQPFESAIVVGLNLVVVLLTWIMTKRYTQSLQQTEQSRSPQVPSPSP